MIFIATPIYGSPCVQYTCCIPKLTSTECVHFMLEGQPVDRMRNELVEKFLASDCSHLMFLDSDMAITLKDLECLYEFSCPIVSGFYPSILNDHLCYVTGMDMGKERKYYKNLPAKPQRVDIAGTGCMLIEREVFEKIERPWFKFEDTPTDRVSEDIYFCRKARAAGYAIWALPEVLADHYKTINLNKLIGEANGTSKKSSNSQCTR